MLTTGAVDPWIDRLLAARHDAKGPNDAKVQQVYEQGFDRVHDSTPKPTLHCCHLTLEYQFNAVTSIFFALALTFARLSILVFYLRLSPMRSFRWAVHGVITFLCLETLISVVLSLLVFSHTTKDMVKAADQSLGMFYGISNILVDIAILFLPVGVVVPLQMSARRKIAVLCLFGAGIV